MGAVARVDALVTLGRLDGAHDSQAVDLGEGEVALVLRGDGHDGPGAVGAQHVVGHVDRHFLVVEGVDHVGAGEGPALVEPGAGVGGRGALEFALLAGARDQALHGLRLGLGGELGEQRVLGRDHRVGDAESRVGAGGEDPEGAARVARQGQVKLDALAAADPVALHRLDPLGPLEGVDVVEELLGVVGDLEEPLLQVAPLHQVARPVAGAVRVDLLVGQDRRAPGAPVDRRLGAVGQTGLEELEEDGLGPLHVARVVAEDLTAPVVDGAEAAHRVLELGHARVGEEARVAAGLDGGVLRRQTEGVEAEGGEDRLAPHGLVANHQVTEGVVADVALVRGTRGVGVHAQGEVALARVVVVDLVGALVEPTGLPFLLYCCDVKGAGHLTSLGTP